MALIVVAALLVPFAGWSWWQPAIIVGGWLVARLARIDRLLRGWDAYAAGVVATGWLANDAGPWACALAFGAAAVAIAVIHLLRTRRLSAFVVTLCAAGLIAGIAGGLGYDIQQRNTAEQQRQQAEQQQRFEAADALPHTPNEVLLALVGAIAKNAPLRGCPLFSPTAAAQFANSIGAPNCATAVGQLATRVTDHDRYNSPFVPGSALSASGGEHVVADGCELDWSGVLGDRDAPPPGPRVGRLELERQQQIGYLIVSYTACQR
ncbi:hypothetical protein [Kutzneria buriramensis]|uniref:Uncharacterized protein n=1 Tax=Kutzneria buriramensis TaxID=1045776 RepID=A0A3E0HH43_9PSEU|nr:hypothetical protein [Kutzneria buriramensis]REH44666.1 hypothetical protein BCF44_108146 [Kutzneria buriramensis]